MKNFIELKKYIESRKENLSSLINNCENINILLLLQGKLIEVLNLEIRMYQHVE